jgi:glyoxylate reductase
MGIVVCTADLLPEHLERLEAAGHEVRLSGGTDLESMTSLLSNADALICMLTEAIGPLVLDTAPGLKIVANVAVGYENIDVPAAIARGVVVTNTPNVLTESTADHAFALLLAAARRIPEADQTVRGGAFPAWGLQQHLTGLDVHGKTLGIVGLGRIGAAVARRGKGFGMSLLYHSRIQKPVLENELGIQLVSFQELLVQSDFVCVHVPATTGTHHMFNTAAFAQMKSTAILVNVARGAIVDEAALVTALQEGTIAGAGLDVFEHEPSVHPGLLELREHVVLAPHLGSATEDARRAMGDMAIDNVLAVLSGKPPLTAISAI